jgi:hypothetical protein
MFSLPESVRCAGMRGSDRGCVPPPARTGHDGFTLCRLHVCDRRVLQQASFADKDLEDLLDGNRQWVKKVSAADPTFFPKLKIGQAPKRT